MVGRAKRIIFSTISSQSTNLLHLPINDTEEIGTILYDGMARLEDNQFIGHYRLTRNTLPIPPAGMSSRAQARVRV